MLHVTQPSRTYYTELSGYDDITRCLISPVSLFVVWPFMFINHTVCSYTIYLMVIFSSPLCIVELTTSAVRLQHVIYETLEDFAAYTYHGKTLRWNTVKNTVVHSDYKELPS